MAVQTREDLETSMPQDFRDSFMLMNILLNEWEKLWMTRGDKFQFMLEAQRDHFVRSSRVILSTVMRVALWGPTGESRREEYSSERTHVHCPVTFSITAVFRKSLKKRSGILREWTLLLFRGNGTREQHLIPTANCLNGLSSHYRLEYPLNRAVQAP